MINLESIIRHVKIMHQQISLHTSRERKLHTSPHTPCPLVRCDDELCKAIHARKEISQSGKQTEDFGRKAPEYMLRLKYSTPIESAKPLCDLGHPNHCDKRCHLFIVPHALTGASHPCPAHTSSAAPPGHLSHLPLRVWTVTWYMSALRNDARCDGRCTATIRKNVKVSLPT